MRFRISTRWLGGLSCSIFPESLHLLYWDGASAGPGAMKLAVYSCEINSISGSKCTSMEYGVTSANWYSDLLATLAA